MADTQYLLALFPDIDPAAEAIDRLHAMDVTDDRIDVISGIPFTETMLGRPKVSTFIPRLALGGAFIGFLVALFLIFGIPTLFPLNVGGQPMLPFPPLYIIAFEMIMLGLMGTAFIGLFLAGKFPSYEPKIYVPEVSDGKIAVVFSCPIDQQGDFEQAMTSLGAEWVRPVEAKPI